MKLLELWRLFVESRERIFFWSIFDARFDEIAKYANEDEWADKDGVNHRPDDYANDGSENED